MHEKSRRAAHVEFALVVAPFGLQLEHVLIAQWQHLPLGDIRRDFSIRESSGHR